MFANLKNNAYKLLTGERAAPQFAEIAVLIMVVGLLTAAVMRLVPIVGGLLDRGAGMLGG